MELGAFAHRVVTTDSIEEKLAPPSGDWTDDAPGPAIRLSTPGRPAELRFAPTHEKRVPRVPSSLGFADPAQRLRILHGFANHELQAVELFAWALLAFPDAPSGFRRGLLGVLVEEQGHVRLYLDRLRALGGRLGDQPVSGYFWSKVADFEAPIHFVCAMSLTFESANLDHSLEYAAAARAAGDRETAGILERIHAEEIGHVGFGWHWLGRLRPERAETLWETYAAHLKWPLHPALARGRCFDRRGREAAGLDADFIERLEAQDRGDTSRPRSSGEPPPRRVRGESP